MPSARLLSLSQRQRECLRLVARGLTTRKIAAATGLRPSTVDGHIRMAMLKLNAKTRAEAGRLIARLPVEPVVVPPRPPELDALAAVLDGPAPGAPPTDRAAPATQAAAILRARTERQAALPIPLLGEPCWDVLLALYVADAAGQPLALAAIANRAGIAPTTALRAVALLEQDAWVARRSDPAGGMTTVTLTERAATGLDHWLAGHGGLPA